MDIAKASLVYFSPTGATKTILGAIGQGLDLPCTIIDMTLPAARERLYAFGEDELVVIGFPVYGGRLPRIQEAIFPLLGGRARFSLPVVVYGNRAFEDALLELATLCRGKGLASVAAAAFIGQHSFSDQLAGRRPDAQDREQATRFGRQVAAALRQKQRFEPDCIPGNVPFKELPPKIPCVPETSDACIACGICAEICPMQAIALDDPARIDGQRCILCAACVKQCPQGAKRIGFAPLLAKMADIVAANRAPKPPSIFLPQ